MPRTHSPPGRETQYLVSTFSGQAQLRHLRNDRYGEQQWATVHDVVAAHLEETSSPSPA